MKIHGKSLIKPNIEIIILPRGDGEDIVFKAKALADMEKFDLLCKMPEPPVKLLPGNKKVPDFESPKYKADLAAHGKKKLDWMIIQSLSATEGLEWETVDHTNSDTWDKWNQELKDAGLSDIEIGRVVQGVMDANCLNEDKIEAARQRFFTGVQEALAK